MTTKLSEDHLLSIESIPYKVVKKRITRELENLDLMCSLISIENDINDKDINGNFKPVITILDNTNNMIYSITLNMHYPFRQPSVKINFRSYYEFLRINSTCFSVNLKKIHKINCLCCSTITCGDKWTPAFTTNDLITEIRKFKGYKRDLINKMLADKIKLRHLIGDIDLDSWLF